MRKGLLVFLLTLSLISALPYKTVRAIDCIGDRYSVDQIISQTEKISLGCFALTDYDGAANLLTLSITDPNQDGNTTDALKNITITYYGDNPNTTVVEAGYSKIVAADRAMAYSQNVIYTPDSNVNVNSIMDIYANSALTTNYTYMDSLNPPESQRFYLSGAQLKIDDLKYYEYLYFGFKGEIKGYTYIPAGDEKNFPIKNI